MANIAIIQYQTPAGSWQKVSDCLNNPSIIKQVIEATFRSNPHYQKIRAIDSITHQLIDLSVR